MQQEAEWCEVSNDRDKGRGIFLVVLLVENLEIRKSCCLRSCPNCAASIR